jgi:hypothetical protein
VHRKKKTAVGGFYFSGKGEAVQFHLACVSTAQDSKHITHAHLALCGAAMAVTNGHATPRVFSTAQLLSVVPLLLLER